jgi:hypothetical protein
MNALRPGLPPLPPRMRSLQIDERGYPVPFFVAMVDGKPDHRVADGDRMTRALRFDLCWMCGQRLGRFKSFCIGPMCAITRTISEPPSHIECLLFAAQACPFMTRPKAKRREANLPEEAAFSETGLRRNPGAVCIWTTKEFKVFREPNGERLFRIGSAFSMEWFAEGRHATLAEVVESIVSGYPMLEEVAKAEDAENPSRGAMADLEERTARIFRMLDGLTWPAAPQPS